MNTALKNIIATLSALLEIPENEILDKIEIPSEEEFGDYAYSTFHLQAKFKQNPSVISQDLTKKIKILEGFEKIEAKGGYVNFYLKRDSFIKEVLNNIDAIKRGYGSSDIGKGKTIVIDFSSPNIAHPFSISHLRSTNIGNSLCKIFEFLSYKVVGINHLGDWGTQFGKLITAYKRWGSAKFLEDNPLYNLYKLYVRFHQEAKVDLTLEPEARETFKRMEQADESLLELWKWFRDVTLTDFKRIYDRLHVKFSHFLGESFYNPRLFQTYKRLEESGILTKSNDAMIVDLSKFNLAPCLIKKADETSLYSSRDICAAEYRYQKFRFSKMLYVVGSEQKLYFKQLFKVFELMGYEFANDCVHVDFGLFKFKEGALSSREGNIIFIEDVLNRAQELASNIIKEKNPDLKNKEEIASEVAIGAIKFFDLDSKRTRDINFDWDSVLNFDGATGPYLQYTHVRLASLLARFKGKITKENYDFTLLAEPEEFRVVKILSFFPDIVEKASQNYEPSIIAKYLIRVASEFNRFYTTHKVLGVSKELEKSRIFLCYATKIVIKNGLSLLGIETPERM
jgi:arginyl-tRNA synthetase